MNPNEPMDGGSLTADAPLPTGGGDQMVPLGMGDFESDLVQGPLAGAEEGQKLNTGTILIVVIIIVAAVGLFSMRKLSQMSATSEDGSGFENMVESFYQTLMGSDSADGAIAGLDSAPILQVINEKYSELQVPWSNVQGDPFARIFEPGGSDDPTPTVEDNAEELRRAEIQVMFELAVAQLRLKMIVLGSPSMANMNEKIVRVGQAITIETPGGSVEFEIIAIEADSVTVLAEDSEYQVRLERTILLDRDF